MRKRNDKRIGYEATANDLFMLYQTLKMSIKKKLLDELSLTFVGGIKQIGVFSRPGSQVIIYTFNFSARFSHRNDLLCTYKRVKVSPQGWEYIFIVNSVPK